MGSGPGDPSLLTLRAVEVLSSADVVAYDRLVHPDVLKLAPKARLIDVGKRPGRSAEGQKLIEEVLVREAKNGERVVRLKGGDPFVFGRGAEEAEVLVREEIPFEVVPGVTSAIAGPAYAGIPLTHRSFASWAVLATGHEDETKTGSSLDWDAISKAPTSVFLMGVKNLRTIADNLIAAGKDSSTPAGIIASATLPEQKVVVSTLSSVADDARRLRIAPPAILVVGEVVSLASLLSWTDARPLAGKRVFVARARTQSGKLSAALREAGAVAVEVPAIRIGPPSSYDDLDNALSEMGSYDWVVFTSANAVSATWTRLDRDARAFGGCSVAAVGPATAEALAQRGIRADLVPETFSAQALGEAIGGPDASGRQVLIPAAEDAPPDLRQTLALNGWEVTSAPAYRTVIDTEGASEGARELEAGVDAICFTSGSTVTSFIELWGKPPKDAAIVCIGPKTSEEAQSAGLHVDAVADEATISSLVEAVRRVLVPTADEAVGR